ncbi:CopG family transcriptional regulator [Sulfolobus sp. E11-6]|uniref:CopG family transcriptional regulator n=1 Tax=Sulfolobus sp. E11-6 TaxID=2663020 RepID=UPI00129634A6|nr:CopG family transcriptional regulator [Sulfolobus sp. E11-6]QGA67827.1 CopG family transcriptional regulator [Sulfolobus sp. E11-6]
MRIISIKLTDEEYKELEERARKEGFVLLSDFIKSLIFSTSSYSHGSQVDNAQIVSRIEKKMQDMINPFTSQIDELKQKIAILTERIEILEEKIGENKDTTKDINKKPKKTFESKSLNVKSESQHKKTAIDILRDQGVIYESELKLNNPDAFFDKLETQGAIVITTDPERIAIDSNFYEEFKKKIGSISTSDEIEVQKYLTKQEYKLFQKLRQYSVIYFDADSKSWKFVS